MLCICTYVLCIYHNRAVLVAVQTCDLCKASFSIVSLFPHRIVPVFRLITGLGNFEMSAAKSQAGGGGGGGGGQPTKANYTLYGDSEELNRQAATLYGLV